VAWVEGVIAPPVARPAGVWWSAGLSTVPELESPVPHAQRTRLSASAMFSLAVGALLVLLVVSAVALSLIRHGSEPSTGRSHKSATPSFLELARATDETLLAYHSDPGVRHVWIRGAPRVTEEGLRVLTTMPNLVSVSLWNCQGIVDDDIAVVAKCTRVRELILSNMPANDDGVVACIAGLPELREIVLGNVPKLTGRTTRALEKAPQLEHITIHSCPDIGPADIASLRAALPNCEIAFEQ
jgi:hypothetical protein